MEPQADRSGRNGAGREDVVGIVVSHGNGGSSRPCVSAFVWGDKIEKHASLRYGRWKETDRE